jgi:hypothetical protein
MVLGKNMEDDNRDDMEQAEMASLKRWVPSVVVGAVVLAFVTLAWYAYHAQTQSLKDDDLLVVEADKTPMKEKPADPGGMQFPNQDKTVFETFGNMQPPPQVENVLPAPEEPLPKEADASGTTTWINDKLHKTTDSFKPQNDGEPEQVIGDDKPRETPVAAPAAIAAPVEAVKTQDETAAETEAKEVMLNGSEEPEKAPEKAVDRQVPVKSSAVIEKVPVKAKANGPVKVQLGAYRSDKEAREAWDKMVKKNAALAAHAPIVVKADLGAKGVFYRLRAGGFASAAAAKKFCDGLKGQACLVAEK